MAVSSAALHPAWSLAAVRWAAFLILAVLVMWPTAESMVGIWWSIGTYNHAFAVPVIMGWLAWQSRHRWLPLEPVADARWWPVLLLASALVAVGEAAFANAPAHVGLVLIVLISVPALFGTNVARVLAFPLAYGLFMVPVGDFLLQPMMEATATFTVAALRASGVPVYREGLMFVIPSGNWSVVEACSGLRYLIASVSVGTLYAYISYASWSKRLAFIAFAVLVPIVANWVRAFLIVMLGHLTNNELAAGADHLVYGWVLFGLVMAVLFVVGGRWADDRQAVERHHARHDHLAARLPTAKGLAKGVEMFSLRHRSAWGALVVCLIISCLPAAGSAWLQQTSTVMAPRDLPAGLAGWAAPESVPLEGAAWKPRFLGPETEVIGVYRQSTEPSDAPEAEVTLYQAEYRKQDRRHKLLSSENVLVASGDLAWRESSIQGGVIEVPALASRRLFVSKTLKLKPQLVLERSRLGVGQQARQLLVVRLVQIDGDWMEPNAMARMALAWARLTGRPDQSRGWVVSTPLLADDSSEIDRAAARLGAWLDAAIKSSQVRQPTHSDVVN